MAGLLNKGQITLEEADELAGPGLRWFLDQYPGWKRRANTSDNIWETGSTADRVQYLNDLRKNDPATARLLLSSTWSQESAVNRQRFLSEFAAGISLSDKPFLEMAADDRSRPVRLQAALLLCRLPESNLLNQLLDLLKATHWRDAQLRIESSETSDATLAYLLALQTAADRVTGLETLLSLLPPSALMTHLEQSAAEILKPWCDAPVVSRLVLPLLKASLWHEDADWMTAFCTVFGQKSEHEVWRSGDMKALLMSLPVPQWQEYCTSWLVEGALLREPESAFSKALLQRESSWTPAMFQGFVQLLKKEFQGPWIQPNRQHLRQIFLQSAFRTKAVVVEMECQQALSDMGLAAQFRQDLQHSIGIARFRLRMQSHFEVQSVK
ncbi:MAG: hypothetical protein IPL65_08220 [Lewinellaceae bacterium]|nr:hypothetical protein [Lewinellaceae bacterium]